MGQITAGCAKTRESWFVIRGSERPWIVIRDSERRAAKRWMDVIRSLTSVSRLTFHSFFFSLTSASLHILPEGAREEEEVVKIDLAVAVQVETDVITCRLLAECDCKQEEIIQIYFARPVEIG